MREKSICKYVFWIVSSVVVFKIIFLNAAFILVPKFNVRNIQNLGRIGIFYNFQNKRFLKIKNKHKGYNCVRTRNLVHALPQEAFSVYINGNHNHVSSFKSYS